MHQNHKSGFIKVSDGFLLHYSTWGNPNGIPILFLHGGPGLGCSPKDTLFFNIDKHYVIFLDQRGAPKSQPFGNVEGITPFKMVEDINILLAQLNINDCHVFGGSWGSTLALLFAIAHPTKVKSLILRGVFLANKAGTDILIDSTLVPKCYKRLTEGLELKNQSELLPLLCKKMFGSDLQEALNFGKKWDDYAMCLNKNEPNSTFDLKDLYKVRLTAIFAKDYCYLPENYILSNINKIKHIQTTIVQGKYDKITPPFMAVTLHEHLNNSVLHLLEAGHFSSEKPIFDKLKRACDLIN